MSCDVSCDLGGGEVGVERVESSLGFFLVLKSFIVSSMERWSLLLALGTERRWGGGRKGESKGRGNEGGRVEKEGGR